MTSDDWIENEITPYLSADGIARDVHELDLRVHFRLISPLSDEEYRRVEAEALRWRDDFRRRRGLT